MLIYVNTSLNCKYVSCVTKFSTLIFFFVPPNEELEGTLHPKNVDVPPKMKVKGTCTPRWKNLWACWISHIFNGPPPKYWKIKTLHYRKKKKICLTLGQTGTGVLCAFVSVPPFFCNIVYNLSHFVFIQNWIQDYL
jgi:hypothetical protein